MCLCFMIELVLYNNLYMNPLIIKLEALGLNPALCNWVLDFLTGHP